MAPGKTVKMISSYALQRIPLKDRSTEYLETLYELEAKIDQEVEDTVSNLIDSRISLDLLWEQSIEELFLASYKEVMNPENYLDHSSPTGKLVFEMINNSKDEVIPPIWLKSCFWFRPIQFSIDRFSSKKMQMVHKSHRGMYEQRFLATFMDFWRQSKKTRKKGYYRWVAGYFTRSADRFPNRWMLPKNIVKEPREQHYNRSARPMFACMRKFVKEAAPSFFESEDKIILFSLQTALLFEDAMCFARYCVKKNELVCPCCKIDDSKDDRFVLGNTKAFHLSCVKQLVKDYLEEKEMSHLLEGNNWRQFCPEGLCKGLAAIFLKKFGDIPIILQFDGLFWYGKAKVL
jgi:hypothetical protein